MKWRSSAYLAVSGKHGRKYRIAFKARTGDLVNGVYVDAVDGIYLAKGPGKPDLITVLDTTMTGQALDPEAPPGTTVIELGLEREGFRGDWLAISAKMAVDGGEEEDDDIAGVYITRIKR